MTSWGYEFAVNPGNDRKAMCPRCKCLNYSLRKADWLHHLDICQG